MSESENLDKKAAREAEEWVKKQKLLQMSEVSLVLDTYDDIFSDFDPRSYEHRALSFDLLSEIKRATRENNYGVIELHFLIPGEKKKAESEARIKKRLKEHFKRHYEMLEKEVLGYKKRGALLAIGGFAVAILGAIFLRPLSGVPGDSWILINGVLFVLMEPASWFAIWTGFDSIWNNWREIEPDLEFYKKMTRCEITFSVY